MVAGTGIEPANLVMSQASAPSRVARDQEVVRLAGVAPARSGWKPEMLSVTSQPRKWIRHAESHCDLELTKFVSCY
jgi:hypothetical protein